MKLYAQAKSIVKDVFDSLIAVSTLAIVIILVTFPLWGVLWILIKFFGFIFG
jgi:hypothetical protein